MKMNLQEYNYLIKVTHLESDILSVKRDNEWHPVIMFSDKYIDAVNSIYND